MGKQRISDSDNQKKMQCPTDIKTAVPDFGKMDITLVEKITRGT